MKKVDLSKYLNLSVEDQRALGIVADTHTKVAEVLTQPSNAGLEQVRHARKAPELGMPFQMGKKCSHRVSLKERTDVKSVKLSSGVLATPHTCLECGRLMYRLHPGPRRQRRLREEEEEG